MPENTTDTTGLASQYISQVASDLERNVKEQERIGAELTALQERLAALQQDHTVLVTMQQALGVPAASSEPASTDNAVVPSPRKKTASASGTRQPAKKASAQQPEGKKTAGPTLVDLIHHHVVEQSEPRSAAEIAESLRQAHTERAIDTKVVRTTLENLVAKSRIHRTKQGSSVFYTTAGAPEQEAAATDELRPESAG
ncbi:hypothetical protein ACIRQQ_48645 [Streptomyces fuscichromogenes]|uniref:hypothetical protein n=1 Tax=Streptomyces fuscichromogenes TaxID=1324013 RepID=UPI0037F925C2